MTSEDLSRIPTSVLTLEAWSWIWSIESSRSHIHVVSIPPSNTYNLGSWPGNLLQTAFQPTVFAQAKLTNFKSSSWELAILVHVGITELNVIPWISFRFHRRLRSACFYMNSMDHVNLDDISKVSVTHRDTRTCWTDQQTSFCISYNPPGVYHRLPRDLCF